MKPGLLPHSYIKDSIEMQPGLLPHSYIKDSVEMKPGLLPHMIDMFSDNDQQKSF